MIRVEWSMKDKEGESADEDISVSLSLAICLQISRAYTEYLVCFILPILSRSSHENNGWIALILLSIDARPVSAYVHSSIRLKDRPIPAQKVDRARGYRVPHRPRGSY